jgi:hypothetical protein
MDEARPLALPNREADVGVVIVDAGEPFKPRL